MIIASWVVTRSAEVSEIMYFCELTTMYTKQKPKTSGGTPSKG